MKRILLLVLILLLITSVKASILLNGAGATFPYPLYARWFYDFEKISGIKVNYQAIGSGAGIQQIQAGTVDFGASDSPLSSKDQQASNLIMIPSVAGGIAIVYNIPGVGKGLKLSREVIADIFLGKIKTWDDPKITSLNPDLKIPKITITIVRRSDGSGTTDIFTHFLSSVSPEWKEKVGAGTSVNWPTGIGGRGNMGVAGYIKNIVGTIGYLEFTYAVQNNLPYAMVKNKAGNFVYPEIPNIEAALENFPVQKDFYVYPIDAKGKDSYPISGYTFLLIRKNQGNLEKAKALISLVNWIYKEGDKTAKDLYYVPLPQKVKSMALERLKELNYQGKPIR